MTLPKGARTKPVLPFSLRHGAQRGFEREPAADEQEDKRDFRRAKGERPTPEWDTLPGVPQKEKLKGHHRNTQI
jgi:hypothetical protein